MDNAEKNADPRTQSLLPILNDSEEFLLDSSIDHGSLAETSSLPIGNDIEDYISFSEDGEEIFSNALDDFTVSSFDPLIATSPGDNRWSYLTNGQDLDEEVGFFYPGR